MLAPASSALIKADGHAIIVPVKELGVVGARERIPLETAIGISNEPECDTRLVVSRAHDGPVLIDSVCLVQKFLA